MDTSVLQFLKFFQDFIDIAQSENWPNNDTSDMEIKNAFLMSQHIEKCFDKLKNKGVLNEFLSVLNSNGHNIKNNSLVNPPKYIFKKIINSNTSINIMDIGVKQFVEVFSEDKLETCLAELMVESASKELLLLYISKDSAIKFKSALLLEEFNNCNVDIFKDLMKNCNQSIIELFVAIIIHKDQKYGRTVQLITDELINAISSKKQNVFKKFWRFLFNVDTRYFNEMCLSYPDIFAKIVEALFDCAMNLKEGMSLESFYIELNETELKDIVRKICSSNSLRSQFLGKIDHNDEFWQSMLRES